MNRPDAILNDPAIEALDEEIAGLNAEIDERARKQEADVTVRNRLLAVALDTHPQNQAAQGTRGGRDRA